MNHPVIAYAMKGDSLETLGTEGKWTRVQLKSGKTGYIYSSLLGGGSGSSASGSAATIKAEKSANVRSGAGKDSAVIGWAMKGDQVTVLEKSGSWSKVQLKNGKIGYIHSSLLSTGGSGSNPDTPSSATGDAVIVTKNASSTVNLRESKNGKVIASLKRGAALTIIAKDGDWYQVKAGDKTGYVYASYVQKSASAQTTGDVNLRSGAGTSYKILRVLKKGTAVNVLERSGKWVKVQAGDTVGYIYGSYCSK